MATLDDINFNEVAIVAKHNGEVSTWRAWKREIGAFCDPRLWRDTQCWSQYFERLDNNDWNMAGYGLIVMDLDSKTTWSFNDYSAPWSFFLPNPHHFNNNPKEKMWWKALLSEPETWNDYTIDLMRVGDLLTKNEPNPIKRSLVDLLGKERDPRKCLDLLSVDTGKIEHDGAPHIVLTGRHLPANWAVGCEIGKDGPDGLLKALTAWKLTGFAPPVSWEAIDNFMASDGEIPITDNDFEEFPEEIGNEVVELQDSMKEAYEIAKRYRALKDDWSGGQMITVNRGPTP